MAANAKPPVVIMPDCESDLVSFPLAVTLLHPFLQPQAEDPDRNHQGSHGFLPAKLEIACCRWIPQDRVEVPGGIVAGAAGKGLPDFGSGNLFHRFHRFIWWQVDSQHRWPRSCSAKRSKVASILLTSSAKRFISMRHSALLKSVVMTAEAWLREWAQRIAGSPSPS